MSITFCRRLLIVAALILFVQTAHAACPVNQQPCGSLCIDERQLCILEPVPGGRQVVNPGGAPLQIFFDYINTGLWQWAFMMGVAVAILNGTIGGLRIVMSNGDSGKVDAGKTQFISSTIGLVMLLLSGVILEFINPIGFDAI